MAVFRNREWLCRFGVAATESELIHHSRSAGPADHESALPSPLHCTKPVQVPALAPCVLTIMMRRHICKAVILVRDIPHSRELVSGQGHRQVPKNLQAMLVAQLSKHGMGRSWFAPAHSTYQHPVNHYRLAQPCCSHGSLQTVSNGLHLRGSSSSL